MKRKVISALVFVVTFFGIFTNVYAASLSISASSKNVVTGGSVNITVRADGLAGKFSVTSSNGNVLSGGTGGEWLENESKTYRFSAKNIGSATITVTAVDAADSNGNPYSSSKSITINVVKPREKSDNNKLSSLSVEGYSISPEFHKDTLEYTVDLESNVEKITINASKEDGYASLDGAGEKEVQEGDNKFEITVTSETGKSKVYTVNAVVKDSNPIVKNINGSKYTVVKRASALIQPELFEPTTVLMDEVEIPAFYNEKIKITLIGLKDERGSIYLYRYDAKTDDYVKYETLISANQTVILENTDEEVEGFVKTKVTIDEKTYSAYQHPSNKDYVLVYGMDLELGEKNWYLYHIKEKSIQSYMSDMVDYLTADFNKVIEEYKIVLIGMAGLSLLLLLIIIIQIASRNKMKKKLIKKMQSQKENTEINKKEEPKKEIVKDEKDIKQEEKKEEIKTEKTKKSKKNK